MIPLLSTILFFLQIFPFPQGMETFSRWLTVTAGTLYPAYRSYKAVRTKDTKEYVKWMMYWIVFAFYSFAETFLDLFFSFWFPFYYQLKIVFIIWLLSPWTKGASILYRKWVHPTLNKHETGIDDFLEAAKAESVNQLAKIGSQSLVYAKDIVSEAAIRGHQQITSQLQSSPVSEKSDRESLSPSSDKGVDAPEDTSGVRRRL